MAYTNETLFRGGHGFPILIPWPFLLTPLFPHWQHTRVNTPARKTKVSLNAKTKLLEVYDEETGKLVAIQESPTAIGVSTHKLVERLLPDGSLVMVEATIDPLVLTDFKFNEYSSYVVDLICEKITEGQSLTAICGTQGFPTYSELCRWRRQHPEISERLQEARRDRAEYLRDLAYKEALAIEEDTATSDKARFEALMKLAGVDDKERFGNAKGEVATAQPIQILISTGIVREEK